MTDPDTADRMYIEPVTPGTVSKTELEYKFATPPPNSQRMFFIKHAMENGMAQETINSLTGIDPWFLYQMKQIVEFEKCISLAGKDIFQETLEKAKRMDLSDRQLAHLTGIAEEKVESLRKKLGIVPVYKLVDTCAAEFKASTPYYYSTYEKECETRVSDRKKVMILGGGPNRIGMALSLIIAVSRPPLP